MSDRRRIWITGIGLVTPIGTGVDAFRAGLREGRSPVKRIDRFDPSPFRSQVAAQVDDFDPLAWMPPRTARQLDRFSQFGMVAGRLALDDARLTPGIDGAASPERIGIYLGSALGGIAYAEEQHTRYLEKGIRQVAPNLALAVFGGAAPANLGIALDLRGPILSTANSCASGAVALGEALGDLREGRVDAAIAGGCEIPLSPLAFGAFDIIRALSAGHNDEPGCAARPFDIGRDGFVMGEAAALLVLEDAELAARRGATPYAELLGYGATSDAHHMVQPRADGREAARAATVPVSGTKALYGHPLGASGAIEAGICALAIRDGWAPASVNLVEADPETAALLPGLLREGRKGTYRRVLSTSFGFGGLNAALVFGAVD
jgi:3-oxoacyl-[acyl-carrier-protein] synthase II